MHAGNCSPVPVAVVGYRRGAELRLPACRARPVPVSAEGEPPNVKGDHFPLVSAILDGNSAQRRRGRASPRGRDSPASPAPPGELRPRPASPVPGAWRDPAPLPPTSFSPRRSLLPCPGVSTMSPADAKRGAKRRKNKRGGGLGSTGGPGPSGGTGGLGKAGGAAAAAPAPPGAVGALLTAPGGGSGAPGGGGAAAGHGEVSGAGAGTVTSHTRAGSRGCAATSPRAPGPLRPRRGLGAGPRGCGEGAVGLGLGSGRRSPPFVGEGPRRLRGAAASWGLS